MDEHTDEPPMSESLVQIVTQFILMSGHSPLDSMGMASGLALGIALAMQHPEYVQQIWLTEFPAIIRAAFVNATEEIVRVVPANGPSLPS